MKVKINIRIYLYLNVVTINNKIDLKFCLPTANKRSHKEVALKTKYEDLKELEEGRTSKAFPTGLTLLPVPFQLRKKSKKQFFEVFQTSLIKRQRIKVEPFENTNQVVLKWFKSMRGNNIPINSPIILGKAREFADAFVCKDFQTSNAWLWGWKER